MKNSVNISSIFNAINFKRLGNYQLTHLEVIDNILVLIGERTDFNELVNFVKSMEIDDKNNLLAIYEWKGIITFFWKNRVVPENLLEYVENDSWFCNCEHEFV